MTKLRSKSFSIVSVKSTHGPNPRTGPCRPAGTAAEATGAGMPRPAGRPMPDPPAPGIGTRGIPSSAENRMNIKC